MSHAALLRRVAAAATAVIGISGIAVTFVADAGASLSAGRAAVHEAYQAEMARTELSPEWTGDTSTCDAGTISVDYQLQQVDRINYFRTLAGLEHMVSLDTSMSEAAQAAALMIQANAAVSHAPTADSTCHTAEGAVGSAYSNLYQRTGHDALRGFMQDPGDQNVSVGHRNWLLLPQLRNVGIGEVPTTESDLDGGYAVNFQNGFELEKDHSVVAWPAAGFFPEELVDERWSLSIYGADFSNADVTVLRDGEQIDAPIVFDDYRPGVLPSAIITFTPEGVDQFDDGADTVYEVRVSNVVSEAGSTFEYEVTTFDAEAPLAD